MSEQQPSPIHFAEKYHRVKKSEGSFDDIFFTNGEAANIKAIRIDVENDWPAAKLATILRFIRENTNLSKVVLKDCGSEFDNDSVLEAEFQFLSSIAAAVRDNDNVDLELVMHAGDNEDLEGLCKKNSLQAFEGDLIHLTLELNGDEFEDDGHDTLLKLAKQIASRSEGLKCLLMENLHPAVYSTLMSSFMTSSTSTWKNLREIGMSGQQEPYSATQLEAFLAWKATNVEKMSIAVSRHGWQVEDWTFDAAQTIGLISALKKSTNLKELNLTSGDYMNEDFMQLLANYLASPHCGLNTVHWHLEYHTGEEKWQMYHDIVIPALASNSTISCLGFCLNCSRSRLSAMMKDLLASTTSLTVLKIFMERGLRHQGSAPRSPPTIISLAEAFQGNNTLKSLELDGDCFGFVSRNPPLQQTDREEIREELSSFVNSLPCQLRSLRANCHLPDMGLLDGFLRAIHDNENKWLSKLDVGYLYDPSHVRPLAEVLLPNIGNNLTGLSFQLPAFEEMPVLQECLGTLLNATNENFSLEFLDIDFSDWQDRGGWVDTSLHDKLQEVCVRNRVHKMGKLIKAIENGGLTASAVPSVLRTILQRSFVKHKTDTKFRLDYIPFLLHAALNRNVEEEQTHASGTTCDSSGVNPNHQEEGVVAEGVEMDDGSLNHVDDNLPEI